MPFGSAPTVFRSFGEWPVKYAFCRWCGCPFYPREPRVKCCSQSCGGSASAARRPKGPPRNTAAYHREYRKRKPEVVAACTRRYRQRHREKCNEMRCRLYRKDIDRSREYKRKKQAEKYAALALLRLAAKMEAIMVSFETAAPETPEVKTLRAGMAHLTAEQLRADFEKGLRIARDQLIRLAAVLTELDSRGETVEGNKDLLKMLRRIASGELLPEVVVQFAGSPTVMRRVGRLPVKEQEEALATDAEDIRQDLLRTYSHKARGPNSSACGEELPSLTSMAAHASPGDVAEMCMELVNAAEDPRAVAERLLPQLETILKAKKRPKLAFA